MTNETKHTPTPWNAEHNDHYWTIVPESRSENDPYQIGDVCSSYPGEMNQGLQQANARHIVKCVNMHDELVEALKNIIARSHNDPLGTSKVLDMRKIAEKALAKARGETS